VSATLTPAEIGEIVTYIRSHPNIKVMPLDKDGWTIAIVKDGRADVIMHPRTFLNMIREENDDAAGKSQG
jgi:hypothetical protein